jgi:hypothetical protein
MNREPWRDDTRRATEVHRRHCDALKKTLLAKTSKIPPNWDGMEIRQWVMDCAEDAWVSKMDKTRMYRYQLAQIYGL